MPTHHTHHTSPSRPLERTLIAFCLLAALSGVVVYLATPTVYTDLLMLHLSPTDRYPIRATLVLVGMLLVIAAVMVGVLQHWRWLFWLLLIAFGASILDIPVTILQSMGVVPSLFPVWYSLYRMGVALVEIAIAVWMLQIYRRHGVWAMGKKNTRP
jgi:hypothetical protein